MYKKLITIAALLLSAKILALSCSAPITISDTRSNAYLPKVCANDKGDVAICWLSVRQKKEAVTVAYKTQNSTWSSPEIISGWEEFIYPKHCFVNSKGDLFATWKASEVRNNIVLVQVAEKIEGGAWTHPLVLVPPKISCDFSSLSYFCHSDVGFDPIGKLIFIGSSTSEWISKCSLFNEITSEGHIPYLAILIKSPTQAEQNWDTFKINDTYGYINNLSIEMNKKGMGYVFWVREGGGNVLMCRKIQNSQFISEPEVILSSQEYIRDLKGSLNEKGDVVIAYEDDKNNGKIMTKFNDSWSEPLLFTTEKDDLAEIEVSIDDAGNVMAVCKVTIDEVDYLKTIYKPLGESWKTLKLLFLSDKDVLDGPEIKPDGNGKFVVIWENEMRNRDAIFGATFSTITQTWSDPQLLSPKKESCSNCSFVFWASGKGYISWQSTSNGFDTYIQVAELSHLE